MAVPVGVSHIELLNPFVDEAVAVVVEAVTDLGRAQGVGLADQVARSALGSARVADALQPGRARRAAAGRKR